MTRAELSEMLGTDLSNLLIEERRLGRLAAIKEMLSLLSRILDAEDEAWLAGKPPAGGLH